MVRESINRATFAAQEAPELAEHVEDVLFSIVSGRVEDTGATNE